MAFPDAPRVIYQHNPLEEVICQVRFPTILKVDAEAPVAFQEHIRASYPFYTTKPTLELPANVPPELGALLVKQLSPGVGSAAHNFTSRDEKWTLTLTREFLALTCRAYSRWEDFKNHFAGPLTALHEQYAPGFVTRIGLRYRNVIRRSILGLDGVAWNELLTPWIAGALMSPEVASVAEHSATEIGLSLPDGQGRVRVHHGMAIDEASKEPCYVIDADFFDERQTELTNALSRLDFFHGEARLFFRWCIQDRLHAALDPRPVPPG